MKPRRVLTKHHTGTGNTLGHAIVTDGRGAFFVAGNFSGTFAGAEFQGSSDLLLVRFDGGGEVVWARSVGGPENDVGTAVVVDPAGRVFVVGYTGLEGWGSSNAGEDIFVGCYDFDGNPLWSRSLGSTSADAGLDATADGAGGLYILASTQGSFPGSGATSGPGTVLLRIDADGNQLWARQFAWSSRTAWYRIVADGAGRAVVCGVKPETSSSSRTDAQLSCFSPEGELVWEQSYGVAGVDDTGSPVAIDAAGNVFLAGTTRGALVDGQAASGRPEAFVASFDPEGGHRWTRQWEGDAFGFITALAPDGVGGVYIVETTITGIGNYPEADNSEIALAHLGPDGSTLWTDPIPVGLSEQGKALVVDERGRIWLTGFAVSEDAGFVNGILLVAYEEDAETVEELQWYLDREFARIDASLAELESR